MGLDDVISSEEVKKAEEALRPFLGLDVPIDKLIRRAERILKKFEDKRYVPKKIPPNFSEYLIERLDKIKKEYEEGGWPLQPSYLNEVFPIVVLYHHYRTNPEFRKLVDTIRSSEKVGLKKIEVLNDILTEYVQLLGRVEEDFKKFFGVNDLSEIKPYDKYVKVLDVAFGYIYKFLTGELDDKISKGRLIVTDRDYVGNSNHTDLIGEGLIIMYGLLYETKGEPYADSKLSEMEDLWEYANEQFLYKHFRNQLEKHLKTLKKGVEVATTI